MHCSNQHAERRGQRGPRPTEPRPPVMGERSACILLGQHVLPQQRPPEAVVQVLCVPVSGECWAPLRAQRLTPEVFPGCSGSLAAGKQLTSTGSASWRALGGDHAPLCLSYLLQILSSSLVLSSGSLDSVFHITVLNFNKFQLVTFFFCKLCFTYASLKR